MKKHIWTSLAIAFGVISVAAGVTAGGGLLVSGGVIILSALACRSANKRRFSEVKSIAARKAYEFALIVAMIFMVILQQGLKNLIATDPVPNFVIPVICLIFYLFAFYKAGKIES